MGSSAKHIFVGIDSGKTAAFACLDLDGKLLLAGHKRFGGAEWLAQSISAVGIPSVVATDKRCAAEPVRKVNAVFGARLYEPDRDLQLDEKRIIAKLADIRNQHEQDAYAAAVKAYNTYRNKLKQASRAARDFGIPDDDQIKAKVIMKYSIEEAITDKKPNRK